MPIVNCSNSRPTSNQTPRKLPSINADSVGDACDPQPGQMNSLMFFAGFDEPLDADDWAGEANWTVAGGELSSDNAGRYFLRYTAVDASDNVFVVAGAEFSNPLGPNGITMRFGGVFAEADGDPDNNGCWLVRTTNGNTDGFTMVNVNNGGPTFIVPTVGPAIAENSPYEITTRLRGTAVDCGVLRNDGGTSSTTITQFTNYNNTGLGLVSSFTEMRVAWIYAIRAQ